MARLKKRGESGAAKNFITRNKAINKLQISLADFRRLCILKGIHPQQPRHSKRANKGSAKPATFYYTKDIVYLAHEPILRSLRDQKAFAKKLTRAIGRREWAAAKNLDDAKPQYTLDHIIKERYPTFGEALGDIDDALCTIVLFANLPAKMYNIPEGMVGTCLRLKREWDEYIVRTGSLRKTFLSIKGVYFQAAVGGRDITWLVPYPFTQHVPHDVDFRVMSTFLELYTTLLGFVLFKLWSDLGEAYPPKLGQNIDAKDDKDGQNQSANGDKEPESATAAKAAPGISKKVLRKTIRSIQGAQGQVEEVEVDADDQPTADDAAASDPSSEFQTSSREGVDSLPLPSSSSSLATSNLFRNCTFYLDRSTPLSLLSFLLRSYGALPHRIGWDAVLTSAVSPLSADDGRITHVLVDRPDLPSSARRQGVRYVQPQWVVDSANAGVLRPEDEYGVGKTLPPHLSPFVEGEVIPAATNSALVDQTEQGDEEMDSEDEDEEDKDDKEEEEEDEEYATPRPALAALLASSSNPSSALDSGLVDAAELEAESLGGEAEIENVRKQWADATKKSKKTSSSGAAAANGDDDDDAEAKKMARGLLSNRQRKLYDKLSYTKNQKAEDQKRLERRRAEIRKEEKRASKK